MNNINRPWKGSATNYMKNVYKAVCNRDIFIKIMDYSFIHIA